MNMTAASLAARVRELFDYDHESGAFIRRVRLAQRHQVGDRADLLVNHGVARGYRRVAFDSQKYQAHRVAWLYVHGRWPEFQIDHINGDRGDNRIANLRDVPARVNNENQRKAYSNNRCGLLGVFAHQGKWRSRIQTRGLSLDLGSFETPEQAHAAYLKAKRSQHEGCTL